MSGTLQFADGINTQFDNYSAFQAHLLETVENSIEETRTIIGHSLDIVWLVICAGLVFFMQAGFAMVEVGSVSMKNTKNILVKNMLDACIGAISFWLIGYAFAFGDNNRFIGLSGFALHTADGDVTMGGEDTPRLYNGTTYAFFVFQFAFAATAATIVSGAVAERCQVIAYFIYSFFLTAFVYPVVVHWGWANGWASIFVEPADRLFGVGVIDFAGSTVVHMVGGATALIGAIFLGPRQGRFNHGSNMPLPEQSTTFQTVGVLILWFGWYGFNCGSTLTVDGRYSDVAGKVAATTTIAATTSGVVCIVLGRIFEGHINIGRSNNGILAGLVSITAGCSVMETEMAFVTGIIGAVIYFSSSKLLELLKIDDVVDASPVHFFCGMWGTVAASLFAHPDNVEMAYGTGSCGLFYKCEGNGIKQFGANVIFVLVVAVWTGVFAVAIFGGLKLVGLLRVDLETERVGLDKVEHGGAAYEVSPPVKTMSDFLGQTCENRVATTKDTSA